MPFEDEYAHYKPLHRITGSGQVQQLLQRMQVTSPSTKLSKPAIVQLSALTTSHWVPDWVLAIDGSNQEVRVKNGYPMAALGYVTVASVMLNVAKMLQLDANRPIDPVKFRSLESVESIDSALPGSNVVMDDDMDAASSFRRALFEMLKHTRMAEDGESLLDTYQALLAYKPEDGTRPQRCPYDECLHPKQIYHRGQDAYTCPCLNALPLFSTDALRIHEFMQPAGSNQSMFTETMSVVEMLWLVHILRTLEQKGWLSSLQRLAIVLDGPLAVFGSPAWLSVAIQKELARINQVTRRVIRDESFDMLIVGVEKSGAFVEHAAALDEGPKGERDGLPTQGAVLLTDEYIKQHIVVSSSGRVYGRNTYFGRKFFYKTASKSLIVANLPFLNDNHQDVKRADVDQFPRLADTMQLLDYLVSARYRNSVASLISAHAEAAIPMNLGKRVLEKLARQLMAQQTRGQHEL